MTTLNFTAEATAAEINAAIRDADAGPLTVVLAAGTYHLDEPIKILRDDVTLKGAGEGRTVLVTSSAEGHNAQAIVVRGAGETEVSTLKASTVAGDTTTLTLNSTAGVSVGAILKIEQDNDDAYFAATGNTHLNAADENAAGHQLRQMLGEVVAVDGNTVTLKTATPYAFTGSDDNGATTAHVTIPEMLTGIEISDLTVTSDLPGTPGSTDFTNRYEEYATAGQNSAIEITAVEGLSLHDVSTENTASTAFDLSTVYGAVIDSLTATGAFNKGPEGNGYSFLLKTAFNNTLTNLTDQDMRHSVIFGSFTAEHYNTVEILSTNRDINFHGSPDSGNTIVVDRSVLEFEEGDLAKKAVAPGNALIHPNATIEANDVTFRYLVGSWAADVVHGHDDGSKLFGMGANDVLMGGEGVDYLVGGEGDDTISGGGGADTFVYRRGYGLDVVTDFDVARDRLDLAKTGVTARGYVSARQVDGDTVLSFGEGNSLTLEGIDKAEFARMRITFSDKVTKGVKIAGWGSDLGFTGTHGNDRFDLKPGNFKNGGAPDLIGLAGVDTLRIVSGSTFDSSLGGRIKGIDVLDLSAAPRRASAAIDADFVDQSDKNSVTIKYGKLGLYLDTTDIEKAGQVKLAGKGQVLLGSKGGVVSSDNSGAINVVGNSGDDVIRGGKFADRIEGGRGRDTLTGGGGNDAFVFIKKTGTSSADVITDYHNWKTNDDHFELDAAAWGGVREGWLKWGQFKVVKAGDKLTKHVDASDRVIYDKAHGDVWFDADGSGKKAYLVKIAEVPDGTVLSHHDFLII